MAKRRSRRSNGRAAGDDPLRLLTYNVKMLPGAAGKGKQDLDRAREICRAILAAEPPFDILCLQEVFDEDVRDVIAKRLKPQFPHQVAKSHDHDLFNEDSGLFFASRLKILASRFEQFDDAEPFTSDYFADKGIFAALIDASSAAPGAQLLVFNTHLQSTEAYDETRSEQLGQITWEMRRLLRRQKNHGRTGVLLVGDFNVIAEKPADSALAPTGEYGRMLSLLGYPRDLFREKKPADPGFTWDGARNRTIPPDDRDCQRLDYVLAFDRLAYDDAATGDDSDPGAGLRRLECADCAVAPFGDVPGKALSDHYGVEATLRI